MLHFLQEVQTKYSKTQSLQLILLVSLGNEFKAATKPAKEEQ